MYLSVTTSVRASFGILDPEMISTVNYHAKKKKAEMANVNFISFVA